MVDGRVEGKFVSGIWLKGLAGYHGGLYAELPTSRRMILRGEIGYELLRVRSLSRGHRFEIGRIHHLKGGVLLGWRFLDWWMLEGGLEGVGRSSDVVRGFPPAGLNGEDIAGFYWQGIMGTDIEIRKRYRIGLRMTIPRIASLNQQSVTINNTEEGVEVEKLRAFQLVFGIPIYSGGFRSLSPF